MVVVWRLVEFDDYFEFPSEIYRLDTKGTENRVFAKRTLPSRTFCSRARRMQRDSNVRRRIPQPYSWKSQNRVECRICRTGRRRRWTIGRSLPA